MDYPIYCDEKIIGSAAVKQKGLYTFFSCHCMLPGEEMHRIIAVYPEGMIDLGICIPKQEGYVTEKTIPTKQVFCTQPKFIARSLHGPTAIPLNPKREFLQLQLLPSARFDPSRKCLITD